MESGSRLKTQLVHTKVINLWGGPGSGKSTTAADLFRLMKLRGHKVELVTEYAKELTYSEKWEKLAKQREVLEEQYERQNRLKGLDYIITDSPIPLSLIYAPVEYLSDPLFEKEVFDKYTQFMNLNFVLHRVKPYSRYGRIQTSEQAKDIDQQIKKFLRVYDIEYTTVRGDEDAAVMIYNVLIHNYDIKFLGV